MIDMYTSFKEPYQSHDNYPVLWYLFFFSGSMEVVEMLISAGADVNVKGYNGNTPLILAANGGHTGIAKLLLKHPDIKVHDQVSVVIERSTILL